MAAMRVLLLGGTTEASELARRLADDLRYDVTLSLAGVTRNPVLPNVVCRIGGFGGVDGLCAWLRAARIAALIDATHPFATRISGNSARAAAIAGIPSLRIDRPEWTPQPGDRWTRVADAAQAAAWLGGTRQRVLLTVGSNSLAAFNAPAHDYVVRCIDPPPLLPPGAALLLARGPFTLDDERALLAERRITVLVSKNSGGAATAAKLLAARQLGMPVVMIDRPLASTAGARVDTTAAALAWLERITPT